jgi:thiamine-monophosphate kinase
MNLAFHFPLIMAFKKHTYSKSDKLSVLGEFGLIKNIQKQCGSHRKDVATGIGDDAAVIRSQKGNLLVTSDLMIEGIHFDLSLTTFYQLGYKFLAVNISDIFAMGGRAEHFIISLGIPANSRVHSIRELYSGILDLARTHNIEIIGGDTCTSKAGLTLSGTLMGRAKKAITRSGARAGDAVYVTSTMGDSAMGFKLLQRGRRRVTKFYANSARLKLIKAHVIPDILPLKTVHRVSSMIDISDGLLIDLSHICDESRVGAEILKKDIPLSKELIRFSNKLGEDPLSYALRGGEDYCLLFTARPDRRIRAYRIGTIIPDGRYIVDEKGKRTTFKTEGYEHFK